MKLTSTLLISLLLTINVQAADQDTKALIEKAVASEHRSATNKARDVYRHPVETLSFFGIQPDMKVLEVLSGRGWYTEILASILKDNGELTISSFGDKHPNDYLRGIHADLEKTLNDNPELYSNVKVVVFEDNGYLKEVADNSQDMVVTFRNTHNWIRYGGIEDAFRSFHRVLKKGGVLGVVQHRASKDSDAKESAQKGYVPESYLIRLVEDIGFELDATSEVNANPKDTRDHPEGVWTLPPSYRLKDVDREKYKAIGESDRMTLRFVKQ
jgi:predicted methyltransferase